MVTQEESFTDLDLKNIYSDFNKEFGHLDGVLDVLKQFLCLWEENYWELLFIVHRSWTRPLWMVEDSNLKYPESLVLLQAIKNGIYPGKTFDEFSVDFEAFRNLHIFLEKLHSLYLGRDLVEDDLWALHRSDLTERVLGVLDQFDVFRGTIFLKDEFFKFLKEISWDSEANSLFVNMNDLFISFLFEDHGELEISFNFMINKVLLILAHSSAVWSDSPEIYTEHVVKAYQTLFKIISTDITALVEKKYYTGQLVCVNCNEIYFLHEDEAPYDFSQCNCGGDLNYINLP